MSRAASSPAGTDSGGPGDEARRPRELPPQAPRVGRSRRWLGQLHFTGVFWFRIHRFAAVALPGWALPVAINAFTALFFLALRRVRRAIAANLEAVLGPCGPLERQRRIWRTLVTWAWCNTERFQHLAGKLPCTLEVEGEDHWRSVAGRPGGFVLATAHVGSWDVGSSIARRAGGRRVHVVREPELDPRSQEFIRGLYQPPGDDADGPIFTTHFLEHDPAFGARLLAALRRGDVVALQSDRPPAGGRSSTARLFGRPLALPAGPAALARAAGVPLLPVFSLRDGRRRYRLVIRPPIDARRSSIDEAVGRLAEEIEQTIRRVPHQWFCFRDLWPRSASADEKFD